MMNEADDLSGPNLELFLEYMLINSHGDELTILLHADQRACYTPLNIKQSNYHSVILVRPAPSPSVTSPHNQPHLSGRNGIQASFPYSAFKVGILPRICDAGDVSYCVASTPLRVPDPSAFIPSFWCPSLA